jgi:hypothetical protein
VNWSYYIVTVVYCQYQLVASGDFFSGLLDQEMAEEQVFDTQHGEGHTYNVWHSVL